MSGRHDTNTHRESHGNGRRHGPMEYSGEKADASCLFDALRFIL